MGPVRQSACLFFLLSVLLAVRSAILAHPSMMVWWIFFIFSTMIRNHWLLMQYKIEFGSVPNSSIYSNIFHKFDVFVVISWKRNGWFCPCLVQQSTTIEACQYALALCQNVAFMSLCSDILEMTRWILFMLGTVINHRGLIHIKYTLVIFQNRVFMSILSYLLCIFVISHTRIAEFDSYVV